MDIHKTSGLQIDPRCVKCDRENRVNVTLYELRNHAYICSDCYQSELQHGKTPQLVYEGLVISNVSTSPEVQPPVVKTQRGTNAKANPQPIFSPQSPPPIKRSTTSLRLPPDSLYVMLDLPLTATTTEIERAITQKMKFWMRESDSQEKKRWLDALEEWQDIISSPQRLNEYQAEMQQAMTSRQGNTALSVGGRLVSNAQEFLSACEDSQDGWSDGVRYLRNGRLKQWVFYQVDRKLVDQIAFYQTWQVSDFRSLNEVLYCLIPTRPFRFYAQEQWQALTDVPSATTPFALAELCDKYWQLGVQHLYSGSMIYWLEQSHHIPDLQSYYQDSLARYEHMGIERGVGLELLLERAIPSLLKPQLTVTFNDNPNAYTIGPWDRELVHVPVTMRITNLTRGFVSLTCELERAKIAEPDWLVLNSATSITLQTSSEATRSVTRDLTFYNLSSLKRGSTYCRMLALKMHDEQGYWSTVGNFPITLKTMNSLQGLYGKLWLWGLRGGLPGLLWNFLAGFVLAYIPFLLASSSGQYLSGQYLSGSDQLVPSLLQGTAFVIGWSISVPQYIGSSWSFPQFVGAITGIAGLFAAIGQGHIETSEKQNSSQFRKWTTWLTLIVMFSLFIFIGNVTGLLNYLFSGDSSAEEFLGGIVITCVLIFILNGIIAYLRQRLERWVRARYEDLLHPFGRV